jgi:hypothetical protein
MCRKKKWLSRYLLPAIAVLGAAIGWSSPSEAFIQQFVVDSTTTANFNPVPLGSSTPGAAVSYTIYTGRIFGALNPGLPHNGVITDIGLASPVYTSPTPPSGDATYIANFSIVTPTNPAERSGLLIYEASNRGGNAITTTALIAGATYVQSGWQGDLLAQCSGVSSLPASPYPCVSLSSPYGTGFGTGTYPFFTPPLGLKDFVIQVPVATFDRNPPSGRNIITGPVYSHIEAPLAGSPASSTTQQLIVYSTAFTPFWPVGAPSNMSTSNASFWYDTSQSTDGADTGRTTIPPSAWSWAYCPSGGSGAPNPTWICLGGTFNPDYLYEIAFTAQNPLVQGVGFAATRDFVSFLRYSTGDSLGDPNPIAGTVKASMIVGVSQDGAYDRSFVAYGFNQDESGRIVFDGDWVIIDGRILYMNERWAQPNVLSNLYMGGNEAPVWWADWPNVARGLPPAGMLDHCNATHTCPQVLETWGGNEFYINKMGADLVGYCEQPPSRIACTAEIPQPANVYRYFVKGATHGGGAVSFTWKSPTSIATPNSSSAYLPTSPIPETYTNNALQFAFVGLLGCAGGTPSAPTCGSASVPMPPSVSGITYPSFDSGQLAPATNQTAVGFPDIPIPGLGSFLGNSNPNDPYGGNQAWPSFVYDFGPQCPPNYPISREENPALYCVDYTTQSGVPTIEPPTIQKVLTPYVPTVGTDGNENVGGLPTVLGQAPWASYISWNIIPSGPYAGQAVELNAGYWPFYETTAQAIAAGDPRPSLEQRYGTNSGYQCVAKQAAIIASMNRYLLPSDQTILLADIAGSNVLAAGSYTPTAADQNLGESLCNIEALAETHYVGLNLGIDTYYAFIDLGQTNLLWNAGPIAGNVLLGQGLNLRLFGGGGASGTVQYDPTVRSFGRLQDPTRILPVPTSVTSAALTAAQNASKYAAALPATQTFGDINNSQVIYGNGGLNVIDVANILNAPLTLSGTASDIFVINVSGGIATNKPMTLSGGVLPSHVLFNLIGKWGNVLSSGGNALYGTFLATNGGNFNFLELNLTGALINTGGNVLFGGGTKITASAPFAPFQLPNIVSVF